MVQSFKQILKGTLDKFNFPFEKKSIEELNKSSHADVEQVKVI